MRTFKRENCTNLVRAVIKDGNTTIMLCGKHAYEWSIIKNKNGEIIVTQYPNRVLAQKDWKEIKKLYKK